MFGLTTKNEYNRLKRKIEELSSFFPIAVCVVSPSGIIIETNNIFEELTGYKKGDLASFPSDILSGAVKEKEFELKTKEKADIPVKAFLHKKDKNIVLGIMSVSEAESVLKNLEKKTEEKIRELKETKKIILEIFKETEKNKEKVKNEREKNISVVENLKSGLFCVDNKKRIYIINQEAEKIMEVQKEEIIGEHIFKLNKFKNFKEVVPFLSREIIEKEEKEIRIKERVFIFSFLPMKKQENRLGILVIFNDITKEKAIEKAKNDFVTLAAHQLRTPSAAVKWALGMLLAGDVGEISKPQRELADKAYRANDKMISLIKNLLNLEKIENKKYFSRVLLLSIEKVIKEVLDEYKEEIAIKKIEIRVFIEKKEIPNIMADPEGIKIVITNILDNAIKYTLPKGKIRISIDVDGKKVLISVRDTGIGIPENQKIKIFKRFFRADNVLKMDTEGSGVGLYMSKNIVEAHGGEMWFESKEKKGTCFYFTIPIKKMFSEYITEDFY